MAYPYQPYYQPNYYGAAGDTLSQMKSPYQPTQPIMNPMLQSTQNDLIFVQGESAAKAYLVAPNATVTLWDTEGPTIYIKRADANGVPSMRVLDFTERNAPQHGDKHVCGCGDKFATKEAFEALQSECEGLKGIVNELKQKMEENKNEKPTIQRV